MYTWSFNNGVIVFHGTLEEVFEKIRKEYGVNAHIEFTETERTYRVIHCSVITWVIGL